VAKMIEDDAKPDSYTYFSLVDAFMEMKCPNDAWSMFQQMLKQNIHPSSGLFGRLIFGMFQCDQPALGFQLIQDMESKYGVSLEERHFSPAIAYCIKNHQTQQLNDTIAHMRSKGIEVLTHRTHNAVINGLVHINKLDEARQELNVMKECNIPGMVRLMIQSYEAT